MVVIGRNLYAAFYQILRRLDTFFIKNVVIKGSKIYPVAVQPATADQHDRAATLASELRIPLAAESTEEFPLLLICSADSLTLRWTGPGRIGPVKADFTDPTMLYRLKHGTGRRQNLARAVGLKKGGRPTVIDATAGLGRDGFILAFLGCRVRMLERSPVLHAMLRDGLEKAKQVGQTAEAAARIQISQTDSRKFLQELGGRDRPEVVYIDPMYPERLKSNLAKKEMRILRSLVGDDQDAPDLLKTALQCAKERVVVKRPRLASPLGGLEPSLAVTGKSSRFDVYLT